jgi:hypothetical protein
MPEPVLPQYAWDREPGETAKEHNLFLRYLELGPRRSINKLVTAKLTSSNAGTKLAHRWNWKERALAHDRYHLLESIEHRREVTELARQRIFDHALEQVDLLLEIARGRMPTGDLSPVFDKHQNQIGEKSLVPPGTRLKAIVRALELVGLTVPKRVELSTDDAPTLDQAAAQLEGLSDDELGVLKQLAELDRMPDGATAH